MSNVSRDKRKCYKIFFACDKFSVVKSFCGVYHPVINIGFEVK